MDLNQDLDKPIPPESKMEDTPMITHLWRITIWLRRKEWRIDTKSNLLLKIVLKIKIKGWKDHNQGRSPKGISNMKYWRQLQIHLLRDLWMDIKKVSSFKIESSKPTMVESLSILTLLIKMLDIITPIVILTSPLMEKWGGLNPPSSPIVDILLTEQRRVEKGLKSTKLMKKKWE